MSTSKTEHYQLHAWEPTDSFLRTEFNANFAAIDSLLSDLASGKAAAVFGTYTGDDQAGQTVTLGFTPRAVFFTDREGRTYAGQGRYGSLILPGSGSDAGQIVAGGFRVFSSSDRYIYGNESNVNYSPYRYIAFE